MELGNYVIYLGVGAAFLLLFLISGGFFRASAEFILGKIPSLKAQISVQTLARALMLFFSANLLAAAAAGQEELCDTVQRGYLERRDYGEGEVSAELDLTLDGEMTEFELELAPRKMSAEEIGEMLDRAERLLPEQVFGRSLPDSGTLSLREDIVLAESVEGLPVSVDWMTDMPAYLDWDGKIGEAVPPSGGKVVLRALLVCEDQSRELVFPVIVYPKKLTGEERVRKEAREAVEGVNDETEIRVNLPATVNGKKAEWASAENSTGKSLLLIGFAAAALYIYAMLKRKESEEAARKERMLRNYPGILSKLVLLVTAGMSMRMAMERIAGDYRRQRTEGRREEPGYEEIVRTCREMTNGISEADAYRNLGRRAGIPEYRTFSVVISQNLRKGGSEMVAILGRMSEEAFEERKKRARILGEEAGTKLLGPMLVMLVLVMAILMVPALMSFF